MKLKWFKKKGFSKNYQKVFFEKVECLTNTYRCGSLSYKLPKMTIYI